MGADGGIQDALVVNEEEARESLCLNFHTKKKILLSKVGKNHVTIAKIIKEIRRGSKTKKQFSELNIDMGYWLNLHKGIWKRLASQDQ